MSTTFALHAALARDCHDLGRLDLSRLLLMNDSSYPWFILVPEVADIREIYELDAGQRQLLLDESCNLSRYLCEHWSADKINVAALGNMVPQLHVHHIARFVDDPAWPRPVWGAAPPIPYADAQLAEMIERIAGLPGLH